MNESPGRGGASRRRPDVAVDFKGNFYEADLLTLAFELSIVRAKSTR